MKTGTSAPSRARYIGIAVSSALGLGAVTLPSAGIHAAEDPDQNRSKVSAVMDEVVVMATKKSNGESLQDAPVAVSAFTANDLAITKVNNLQEISKGLPNVELSAGGTFKGVANFSSRGFGINATTASVEPAVGTFVDGVYLGSNYGVLTDFLDVESIEVLRGPQGLLFGKNVTGGAVLLNSARPSEEFLANVSARYETGLDQTYTGVINGGLSDSVSARLAVRYSDDDGYFHNKAPGADDFGKFETTVVRPSIAFRPNDDSEYTLIVETGSMEGDGAPAQSATLYGGSHDVGIEDLVGVDSNWTDIEWTQVTFDSNWDVSFGNGTITNILGWREVESDTAVDLLTAPTAYSGSISYVDQDQWSNELRYNGSFGEADVTAGLYYFTQDMFALTGGQSSSGAYASMGGGDLDHETYGAFIAVDYRLSEALTLFGGVRYTDETKETQIRIRVDNVCSYADKSCPYRPEDSQDDDWQSTSPKVGLRWEPTEDLNFYAYYAKGFRSGGFNIRQTGARAGDPLAPGYDEEEQDAFEVGMKSRFNDGRTRLNAALFYSEIEGLQKDITLPSSSAGILFPQVAANTADAEVQGAELELTHQISDALLLSLNYGYLDAEYTEVLYDLNRDLVVDSGDLDLELTRSPEHSGSASLTYEHPFASGASLLTRLSWSAKAKQYAQDSNNIEIPSKDVIDLFVTLYSADDSWSVSAYGKNLNDDELYEINALLPSAAVGGDFSAISEGRTYGIEVSYNFY